MKLLMITGDRALASGIEGAFYNTLEELHKHFERIDVICPPVKKQKVNQVFENVFIYSSPWPLLFQAKFVFRKSRELFKKINFDLITVHEYPPFYNGIAALIFWRMFKVPYILEIHHIVGYPKHANFKEWLYKFLFRLFIKFDSAKAKAIRVVNQNQVPDYLVKAGISRDKIKYIPSLYLDFDIFRPLNVFKEYDLIFVGRLEPNKGIDLFLETVKILDCKAIIVGSGSLAKEVKFKIENWNLKIDFHGWAKDQREIADLINKSKLLVMTSYNEGGPRVVFESLACGVPVLATPVGLVLDFKSSITVIDWNPDDIASKAKKLLNDPRMYEGMKTQGLALTRQFDKKITIKRYADEIKKVV